MKKIEASFAMLILACAFAPSILSAQWKTYWSYDGPAGSAHWGDLDPAYAACKTGREQSPVDIHKAERADLPALRFEYQSGPLNYLINNGYTIRVNYHDSPGAGNFLAVGSKRYYLTQFHFHCPSEEWIQGKPYAMEVHLMHEAADGSVAGVIVFLKAGTVNSSVERIWEHMPKTKGDEQKIPGVDINPADLVPRDTAYYLYQGSLTAPPCTERVTWIALKTPVEISPEQIAAFARLYPHDVRPIQPLNGRIVKESR